jgi:mono/diheme cytochrome c family protein
MSRFSLTLAGLGLLFTGALVVSRLWAETPPRPADPKTIAETRIAHGRYLVTQVAMCIDCHTPRGPDGQFIEGQNLAGSVLGFTPTVPMPWASAAPGIAGLPAGYTTDDTVRILTTGERPHGMGLARPPMPQYRMSRDDAEAITAYLVSLAPESP